MRIGLIDLDKTNCPNLALMKISAYHKKEGDHVEWYSPLEEEYDEVYLSKVFSFSQDYLYPINSKKVIKGGSGFCIEKIEGKEVYLKENDYPLPDEVEHIYPDYSIYPFVKDTAYGYLSRGCPRGCQFCHVAAKEGSSAKKVADLKEFWNGQKNIMIMDANTLACPQWKELLQQCIESKATVDFNQGLDCRLLTKEKIELLNQIKMKTVHFAYDQLIYEKQCLDGLRLYAKIGRVKTRNIRVFVLTNYDTNHEQDYERIKQIKELGYTPYITIYDRKTASKITKELARWCNRIWIQKSVPFEEYSASNKKNIVPEGQTKLF